MNHFKDLPEHQLALAKEIVESNVAYPTRDVIPPWIIFLESKQYVKITQVELFGFLQQRVDATILGEQKFKELI